VLADSDRLEELDVIVVAGRALACFRQLLHPRLLARLLPGTPVTTSSPASPVFRRAYDALWAHAAERADRHYVRLLHLAASTSESEIETAIGLLLEQRVVPTSRACGARCEASKVSAARRKQPDGLKLVEASADSQRGWRGGLV
jgi:hypothetical protein